MIASLSEVYTYDSLNQLASYKLGTLNGTKTDVTGSPTTSQSWDYDAVGNWDSVTTNSTTQTRSANKQNEITAVSGATTPTYDSNGNLTTDENNYRFVYDAWNKVVQAKNSSNVVIVTYGRDALHRHVTDTVSSTVTDRFFSSDWQLLETKVGSNTVTRNVWSPVYVDGLVLRDRDTDANGTLDERLYALQDANWNTTALVNTTGTVQERYTYTPFGQATFRDGSGSTLSNSAKDWVFLHQGGEKIAAGDYEFRNRVYSPSLGRWLSNDPLGFDAGDQNWYRAISNNLGNGLDPSGLDVGIGGLVVDEMPEIPRNPFGIEVPKNPEDTFWGLIGEAALDSGKSLLEFGYEWTVKPIVNTGYFVYDVATCWMPGQFYNPYLNAYQNGKAGYLSTVGGITVDAASSYLLLKPVAIGLGGAGGKAIPKPNVPRPKSPVSPLPQIGSAPSTPVRQGWGNIGSHGPISPDVALGSATKWLGEGYKEIAPGIFRSTDGLRQFRMTASDLIPTHGNIGPHVHFEALNAAGKVIENLHLPIFP